MTDQPTCTATITDNGAVMHCVLPAGHTDPESGPAHAGPGPETTRLRWYDEAVGATPHEDADGGTPWCCNGNAEDCALCTDPNPPYPFLCPGHPATDENTHRVKTAYIDAALGASTPAPVGPTDDAQRPTREERLAELAEKLCRSYTYGVGLAELEETEPEEAKRHRRASRRLLDWIDEAPDEEKESAFKRGWDRGREAQKKRTAQDIARLEAEVAELRQDRDPDGLRERIRSLEYALHGWDTLMMGRDRKAHGAVPDWKARAGEYLAQLVEAQRELAVLKGHQPSNATRRDV